MQQPRPPPRSTWGERKGRLRTHEHACPAAHLVCTTCGPALSDARCSWTRRMDRTAHARPVLASLHLQALELCYTPPRPLRRASGPPHHRPAAILYPGTAARRRRWTWSTCISLRCAAIDTASPALREKLPERLPARDYDLILTTLLLSSTRTRTRTRPATIPPDHLPLPPYEHPAILPGHCLDRALHWWNTLTVECGRFRR